MTDRLIETGVISRWAAQFRAQVEGLIDWVERFSQGGLIRDKALEEMGAKISRIMGKAGDALVDQVVARSPEIARAVIRGGSAVAKGFEAEAKKTKAGQAWQAAKTVNKLMPFNLPGTITSGVRGLFNGKADAADPKGSKTNPVHVADAGGPDSVVGVSSK